MSIKTCNSNADPDEKNRKKHAKELPAVYVYGKRNWENIINIRLALGAKKGLRGLEFFYTDDKRLIRIVSERLALRDRMWENNKEAGIGLLHFAFSFIPASKALQGIS